jgi:hypothetical protein
MAAIPRSSDSEGFHSMLELEGDMNRAFHYSPELFELGPLPPQALTTPNVASSGVSFGTGSNSHREGIPSTPLLDRFCENQAQAPSRDAENVSLLEERRRGARPLVSSSWEKLGLVSSSIIIAGILFIALSIGFLSFLWFASDGNQTWRHIAIDNRLTTVVPILSLILRTAVTMQAGMATSMLASLALERGLVLLKQTAFISFMRHVQPQPHMFTWLALAAFSKRPLPSLLRTSVIPGLAILLTITTAAIQFTSAILLSDLTPNLIVGNNITSMNATNFRFENGSFIPIIPGDTSWSRRSSFYPTFAEYHEPPVYTQNGILDTGLTLRAFLPLLDQNTRLRLHNYIGKATVVDTRVICMRPNLTNASIYSVSDLSYFVFTGRVLPGFNISQLASMDLGAGNLAGCILPPHANGWPVVLCQLDQSSNIIGSWAGELISEFRPASEARPYLGNGNPRYGTSYLALNVSNGTYVEWREVVGRNPVLMLPVSFVDNNEWQDLVFGDGDLSVRLSVSICYTSFDSADLVIQASSGVKDRKEPSLIYTPESGSCIDFGEIRRQLGQTAPDGSFDPSVDGRGILKLHKRESWFPKGPNEAVTPNARGDDEPITYIRDFADMAGPYSNLINTFSDNFTAWFAGELKQVLKLASSETEALSVLTPDILLQGLVQDILRNGGSIAFALQSIITLLSGSAYYDQLPVFDDKQNITVSTFSLVLTPQGQYRGFFIVIIFIIFHILLTAFITFMFLTGTLVSSLGNSWQAAAQIRGRAIDEYLSDASLAKDEEVEDRIKGDGKEKQFVHIALAEDGQRTEIFHVQQQQKQQ